MINDDVLLRKLPGGDVAAKELYYHKPEIKACLQSFTGQFDQALRKYEGQHMMVTAIRIGLR